MSEKGPGSNLGALIAEINRRYSTNPRDRVAGLGLFAIQDAEQWGNYKSPCVPGNLPIHLPVYHPTESSEDAWLRLVGTTLRLVTMFRKNNTSSMAHQLLTLFPHPSAEHWCPSWSQIMNYPNISITEPQLPDGEPPQISAPLLVYAAHLYREVNLSRVTNPLGMTTHFVATTLAGENDKWTSAHFHPIATGVIPVLEALDESLQYVVIDITGFRIRHLPQDKGEGQILEPTIFPPSTFAPTSDTHLLIICRELSRWPPPSPVGTDEHRRPTGMKYPYRLRRVTSLCWTPPKGQASPWLEFSPAASAHVVLDPDRSHPYIYYPEIFWNTDPEIEVTLQ